MTKNIKTEALKFQLPQLRKEDEARFDLNEIITEIELTEIVKNVIAEADYEPETIYGLFFIFASIQKLAEAGKIINLQDLCNEPLRILYSESINESKGVERLCANIHKAFRAADFLNQGRVNQSQPFVDCEFLKTDEQLSKAA